MNPYNSLLENANFSVKTSNEKITSINSQVIVILDGIICFFIQFCDISLLVLKIRFQVFYFASKKVQAFSIDRNILLPLLSVLFNLQNSVSAF